MANSTTSIVIKPIVAFNRGDTFVFGSWVRTADGARSFQRCLTMMPNPKTGLVTLPEVVAGNLTGKFALQPTRRLRARIRFQLELDVPVGYRMRVSYSAIAYGLSTP
jgi:hypothetical protein